MSEPEDKLSFCARQVLAHDHDRYLTALFVPAAVREDVFALYAFNDEVARTRETVSEPILGQIRLQWWREALDGIYRGEMREHPVVEGLGAAISAHDLARVAFEGLLEAREADLDDAPPADLAALESYADATSGALSELTMQILGYRDGAPVQAARLVGTAWALTGLMRAVAFHAQSRRLYLPDDLTARHGVDHGALFELKPSPALSAVVHEVARRAREFLVQARTLKGEVPRGARNGLLLGVLADRYLTDMARAGFDPFALPPAAPPRPLRLAWASLRRTY